jgi:hypothetical protein
MLATLTIAACTRTPAASDSGSSAPTATAIAGSSAYAGMSNPKAALATFFESAKAQDYSATYDTYYDEYQQRVARDEFVQRRMQASVLKEYRIDSLSENGSSAEASVTLTFAAKAPGAPDRTVQVHESLVKQGSGWRIRVW